MNFWYKKQRKTNLQNDIISANFDGEKVDQDGIFYYIENNTWVRGNTRFISSVEHDISRVSAANE